MFKADIKHSRPGFQMIFANGWTISVQWHHGSYSEGRYNENGQSINAEIAIWDNDGEWYNFGSDTVKGYCTPDEVLEWMNFTAQQTPVKVVDDQN
jgi:hypothetical protein